MIIQCNLCKFDNYSENILCSNCSTPLWSNDEIAKKLNLRISKIEQKHQQEIESIKKDIAVFNTIKDISIESIEIPEKEITPVLEEFKEVVRPEDKEIERKIQSKPPIEKIIEPASPSALSLKIKEFIAPINSGIELFLGVYSKYKNEGKLPIFFMTISGIIAMLFGFGYLTQLSLNYLGIYEEPAKIGIGFLSAIVVGLIGIRLSKRGKSLKEYGSALISLGIILNYLMIYFLSDLGNFPALSSGILGFALICINTLLSVFFSLKYEAKIIAVISLVAGTFTPLYLNATGDGTLYFLYLWLLAIASSYVANKTNWKTLHYLSFVVTMGSLELMVFSHNPSNLIYTIYYHLFAYLYFFITLIKGTQLKNSLAKADVFILAGSLSFFLYNLFSSYESNLGILGILFSANGLLFCSLLFLKWKELSRDTKFVLFVISAALLGFAIPAIFDLKLMGLFWSIEALILVVLGFQFALPTVRKEGYILLAIAFGKLILSSLSILDHWNDTIWHQGFLNYIVLGLVFSTMWFIGRKHNKELEAFENTLYLYIQELVPLCLATIFFISGYHLIGEWIVNLAVIPIFGFIYWKKYFNTKTSDLIGLSHLLLIIIGYLFSTQQTVSYHISDQNLSTQLSIAELLATLWYLKSFYKKITIEDEYSFHFVYNLRVLFFCLLPLIFIHFIAKHAFEFIEIGIWAGTIIAYFLHKKLMHRALQIEFYALSILGLCVSYNEWDSIGFISGVVFIIAFIISEKAIQYEIFQKSIHKKYISILPYVFTALIGSFVLSFDQFNFALGFSIASLTLIILIYFYDKIGPLKNSIKLAIYMALFLNLIGVLVLILDDSIVSILISIGNLILFAILLNNKKNWFATLYSKNWNTVIVFHQIQCIITSVLFLSYIGIDIGGPFLSILFAIHAIIVLFIAMKNKITILNRISIVLFAVTLLKVIFHDINDFSITQKVIVFIILGLILLGASYGYVKLTKHFEEKHTP